MKKLYILALSLLSAAAMQAQTIKVFDSKGNELADNAVVTVSTPDSKLTEEDDEEVGKFYYWFDPELSIQGSADGKIIVYAELEKQTVEGVNAISYQICPAGACATFSNGVATGLVEDYKASSGKLPLEIHISNNATPTNSLILYSKANYSVYYSGKESAAKKFTLIFDYDYRKAGVDNVAVDSSNGVVEYYNLNGVRVNENNLSNGIYVRRQGNQVSKVIIK